MFNHSSCINITKDHLTHKKRVIFISAEIADYADDFRTGIGDERRRLVAAPLVTAPELLFMTYFTFV